MRAREAIAAEREKVHTQLGNVRLALVAVAAAIGWVSFHGRMISPAWLLAPGVLFVAVAAYHSRVLRARDLAQRAVSFYRKGLARLADRWSGTGETGERFDDPHH